MVSGWLHCSSVLRTQSQSHYSSNRGAYEHDPSIEPKNKESEGKKKHTDKVFFSLILMEKRLVLLYVLVPWRISDLSDSQPVSEVPSVGQSCGQADDSDTLRSVRGDEVGPGHNDLQHWTSVLTWKHTQWYSPNVRDISYVLVPSHWCGFFQNGESDGMCSIKNLKNCSIMSICAQAATSRGNSRGLFV